VEGTGERRSRLRRWRAASMGAASVATSLFASHPQPENPPVKTTPVWGVVIYRSHAENASPGISPNVHQQRRWPGRPWKCAPCQASPATVPGEHVRPRRTRNTGLSTAPRRYGDGESRRSPNAIRERARPGGPTPRRGWRAQLLKRSDLCHSSDASREAQKRLRGAIHRFGLTVRGRRRGVPARRGAKARGDGKYVR